MSIKDKELIFQGYMDCFTKAVQKNKLSSKNALRTWNDTKLSVIKTLATCKTEYVTEEDKRKVIREVKKIYQVYCICIKSYSPSVGSVWQERMTQLLGYISEYEAEEVERYRMQLIAGDKLDLKKIFDDCRYGIQISQRPIDKMLDQYLEDNDIACPEDEKSVFITKTGTKFHRQGCTYCKPGAEKRMVPYILADNYGLKPCKCIYEARENNMKDDNNYMTAFVDESIRQYPWGDIEGADEQSQGSYSYIICKGKLDSEKDITEKRTIIKGCELLDEDHHSNYAASEAIAKVLLKIAFFHNFKKKVIIYTDNSWAMNQWQKCEVYNDIKALFDKVDVVLISRKKNKVADKIGRDVAFLNVPAKVMKLIVYKCKQYDEMWQKEMLNADGLDKLAVN